METNTIARKQSVYLCLAAVERDRQKNRTKLCLARFRILGFRQAGRTIFWIGDFARNPLLGKWIVARRWACRGSACRTLLVGVRCHGGLVRFLRRDVVAQQQQTTGRSVLF